MTTKNIVILTGAGISAESGLNTFRDHDGLWCGHRVEDVATPEAFIRNPLLVHEFYNLRRAQLAEVSPNAAHLAIAEFASKWDGNILVITQNVDDLHDRAAEGRTLGSGYELLHMHGELKRARCSVTGQTMPWLKSMDVTTPCPCCGRVGALRPDIVWFGEMPMYMDRIEQALAECDLFISIGTSGNVYPAAGFVQQVRRFGVGHTVELNLEPSLGASMFHETRQGKASVLVPEYLSELAG